MVNRLACALNWFLVCLLLITLSAPNIKALSPAQKKLYDQGILYYDLEECSTLNDQGNNPSGGPVYMLGDSITKGAKSDLERAFKTEDMEVADIDGVVSRSFVSKGEGTTNGLQAIDAGADNIKRANTVVIALGTNSEDADGESSTFKKNTQTALEKINSINPNARVYWVNLFSNSPPLKQKADYNSVINGLDNINIIDMNKENISLSDKIHPDSDGYKKYAKVVADAVRPAGTSTASSSNGTNSSVLDGHKLPATKGGTGYEEPVTAAGYLVGKTEPVTFKDHASLGKEYRDYYITMRWNYVKWNWDGTTADANDTGYNWFKKKPRLVLVTNPETKKSIITAAIESGPAPWTGVDSASNNNPKQGWTNPQEGTPSEYKGRVSGLPPEAFKALDMTSNDQKTAGDKGPDLLYAWAPDQNAKPGPTNLSVSGSSSQQTGAPECSCTTSKGSTSGLGGDVDKFIKALAFQESGGDPNQPGSSGSARGKYQYIDSTWKSSAESYYKPALKYATANQAPESVQDAVAFLEYSKKFKDLDNDLFKLAVSHFYPAANSDPSKLDAYIGTNVITPRQYASKLINSIKSGGAWEKIPLKYSDAPEFAKYATAIGASSGNSSNTSASICSTENSSDNTGSVGGFSWPVDKKYWDSNRVWFLKPHHTYPAADIPVGAGTKVYSMTEGKVKSVGLGNGDGYAIYIEYQGVEFGYFHGTPGSARVKPGDTVRSGQQIMLSGFTGHVDPPGPAGAHLHVNIRVNGQNSCPQDIFKAMGDNKTIDLKSLRTSGCTY